MRRTQERSAVIVIRAWQEACAEPDNVRARITQTVGEPDCGWRESAAAGEREIVGAVSAWLRALATARR